MNMEVLQNILQARVQQNLHVYSGDCVVVSQLRHQLL